jgi:hypothetical protein
LNGLGIAFAGKGEMTQNFGMMKGWTTEKSQIQMEGKRKIKFYLNMDFTQLVKNRRN